MECPHFLVDYYSKTALNSLLFYFSKIFHVDDCHSVEIENFSRTFFILSKSYSSIFRYIVVQMLMLGIFVGLSLQTFHPTQIISISTKEYFCNFLSGFGSIADNNQSAFKSHRR